MLHVLPVAHYWFLEALFLIFVLTMLLERLGWMATGVRFLAVWLLSCALYVTNPLPVHFGLQGAATLLPFFLLGLGCTRFLEQVRRRKVLGWSAMVLVVAGLYFALAPVWFPRPPGVAPLLIGASCCLFLLHARPEQRWLAWIGAFSFHIYLFHSMFSAASRIALQRLGVEEIALLFAAGLCAGMAGPVVAGYLLRRLPMGHWVLGEPRRAKPARGARLPRRLPAETVRPG
jgi:peptidoglycan/LPS O-acetylase OafA/YrhL